MHMKRTNTCKWYGPIHMHIYQYKTDIWYEHVHSILKLQKGINYIFYEKI